MRDITAEIAQYIRERIQIAAFADALPDEPDEAAGVYIYVGTGAASARAGTGAMFYPRAVRIRVRACERARAFELARRAFALLSSGPEETPVSLYGGAAMLTPMRAPALVERDNRERAVFSWDITAVV